MGSGLFNGDCLAKPTRVSRRTFVTHGRQFDLAGDLSLDSRPSTVLSLHDAFGSLCSALCIERGDVARLRERSDRGCCFHRDQISARCHKSSPEHRVNCCCSHSRFCHLLLSTDASKCGLKGHCCGGRLAQRLWRTCLLKFPGQWLQQAFRVASSTSPRRLLES